MKKLVRCSVLLCLWSGMPLAVTSGLAAEPDDPTGVETAGVSGVIAPDSDHLTYSGFVKVEKNAERAVFNQVNSDSPYARDTRAGRISFVTAATNFVVRLAYAEVAGERLLSSRGVCLQDGKVALDFTRKHNHRYELKMALQNETPDQARRYDIVLPLADQVEFLGLELDPGGLLEDPPGDTKPCYVAYGDSITQGLWASGPMDDYVSQVAAAMGWSSINLGLCGRMVTPEDSLLCAGPRPDVISVLIGINDCLQQADPEEFRKKYARMLYGLRKLCPKAGIAVITPLPLADPTRWAGVDVERYAAIIRDVVRTQDDPRFFLIEGAPLIPVDSTYFKDGLHPNDRGFAIMAGQLISKMVEGGL